MPELLSAEDVAARLAGSAWRQEGATLVRDLEFGDFAPAIAFVNRVAEAAERAKNQPDIRVHGYKHVELSLSTHSAGGITENDVELAREIDALA